MNLAVFANFQTKIHYTLSSSTKTPPLLDFRAIGELVYEKTDPFFGWTGRYSVVHGEFPAKFVSLIRIENRKKVS